MGTCCVLGTSPSLLPRAPLLSGFQLVDFGQRQVLSRDGMLQERVRGMASCSLPPAPVPEFQPWVGSFIKTSPGGWLASKAQISLFSCFPRPGMVLVSPGCYCLDSSASLVGLLALLCEWSVSLMLCFCWCIMFQLFIPRAYYSNRQITCSVNAKSTRKRMNMTLPQREWCFIPL